MAEADTPEQRLAAWRQQYGSVEDQWRRKVEAAHAATQAAVDDVRDDPPVKYPSLWSVAVNHPGIAGYQVMSDPEYQQASKYDRLMRRLQDVSREHGRDVARESPLYMMLTNGGSPEPMRDRSMWGQYWGSKPHAEDAPLPPYRHRGVLAPGQPIRNGFEILSVPFSAVANTAVRPFLNLDKAAAEAPEVANKTFMGIPRAAMALMDPSYKGEINAPWAKEQKVVDTTAFDSPAMTMNYGNPGLGYRTVAQHNEPTGTVEGPQILEEAGYPDHWSRTALGLGMEAAVDPFSGVGRMAKNAGRLTRFVAPEARRAAMTGVARGAAGEAMPVAGMTALLEALKRAESGR